jgi:hypothetical protein
MHPLGTVGGEGASAHVFGLEKLSIPALIVWPLNGPFLGASSESVQQIYYLAYQWAQAALRPSAYSLSQRVSSN